MQDRPRRHAPSNTVLLGGWLFADLLLATMVIFLVATPGSPAPTPTPVPTRTAPVGVATTPTPQITPTPIPSPAPTPRPSPSATILATLSPRQTATAAAAATPVATVCVPSIVLVPIDGVIPAGPAGADPSDAQLKDVFAQYFQKLQQQRSIVGLIYAYGHEPDATRGAGTDRAQRVMDRLKTLFPDVFPARVITKPYFYIDNSGNHQVDFDAYYYSTTCSP